MKTVFFDLGDTLGTPVLDPATRRLLGFEVFPFVPAILESLVAADAVLGVISNTGDETEDRLREVLAEASILDYFRDDLLLFSSVEGITKEDPELFRIAAERAGNATSPDACVFVGEDRAERAVAAGVGFRVSPHPSLVLAVLGGDVLSYAKVSPPEDQEALPWRPALAGHAFVPLHVTRRGGRQVYGVASAGALARLDDLGFEVDRLASAGDPDTTELYLLRDDRQVRTGFLATDGQSQTSFVGAEPNPVISSCGEGLLVALPAGRSVEEVHFEEAQHGHTLKLTPDLSLIEPFGSDVNERSAAWLEAPAALAHVEDDLRDALAGITAGKIGRQIERYSGERSTSETDGSLIRSRHILHPDNGAAVDLAARDLETIGAPLTVELHRFTHEGQALFNVVAAIEGAGASEAVLVTAHLDSTAAFAGPSYKPRSDPAPGADDDASGLAAVLSIAESIAGLARAGRPRRHLRFVLFNAEEHGLVGSKHYARARALAGEAIAAVFQMDMIGFRGDAAPPPLPFEVHAGFPPSIDVERRSLALADRIRDLTAEVSPDLVAPQVYGSPDPAARRSDHASFHERGYAACTVSEDFFVGPAPESPSPQPNPNYHRPTDTHVDPAYAAAIARVVAAAAWITANA